MITLWVLDTPFDGSGREGKINLLYSSHVTVRLIFVRVKETMSERWPVLLYLYFLLPLYSIWDSTLICWYSQTAHLFNGCCCCWEKWDMSINWLAPLSREMTMFMSWVMFLCALCLFSYNPSLTDYEVFFLYLLRMSILLINTVYDNCFIAQVGLRWLCITNKDSVAMAQTVYMFSQCHESGYQPIGCISQHIIIIFFLFFFFLFL